MSLTPKETKRQPSGPFAWFLRLRRRLQNRPDTEHETMLNGLIFYCLINVYAAAIDYTHLSDHKLLPEIGAYSLVFGFLTLLAFFHMLWNPAECPPRKIAVLALYVSNITYAIHLGGELFLWLYPMLLWAVLGYGFRFGNRYLLIGAVMAVVAFTALINLSPFWLRYPALSWGCVAGLVILPAYVSVLIRKLSEAKRQAEESNKAKSAFLASISHELRTPLNAIIGLSDLMKATHLSREQSEMNETIGESGRALLSLINSILDLSRLEVGRMPKNEQRIDLYRLLHRTLSMIEVPARARNLKVSLQIGQEVPRFILSYLKHIEDSVVNLASNAVKFTEQGFVQIRVHAAPAAAGKLRLRIEVIDSGIGVAKDVQERIFERFTQADDTIIDKFGGTGLGLATVKQMIEDVGGEVGVVSEPGAGSTFWLELDVAACEETGAADFRDAPIVLVSTDIKAAAMFENVAERVVALERPEDAAAYLANNDFVEGAPMVFLDSRACGSDLQALARTLCAGAAHYKIAVILDPETDALLPREFCYALRRPFDAADIVKALVASLGPRPVDNTRLDLASDGKRRAAYSVLVADDNKVNRTVIGKILSQAGHTATVVENGQQALDLMQTNDYDIALFDLNMPVLSGVEAAQLYSFSSLGGRRIPIAALTADATPEAERRCAEAGMVACLTKPIEAPVLLAALDDIVRAHGRGEHLLAATADAPAAEAAAPAPADLADEEPVDLVALRDLYELGGAEFVQQVLEHFLTEAGEALDRLEQAVAEQNYRVFRDEAHALRSGAANVGARKVFKLCLQWREITPQDIALKGDECVREMSEAVTECSEALAYHCRRMMLDEILPPSGKPGEAGGGAAGLRKAS